MTQNLSIEKIDEIEQFILEHSENKCGLAISNSGVFNAFEYLENIDDKPLNSYYIFSSDGMGYIVYAIYKSSSGNVYIINVSLQSLGGYILVEKFMEQNRDLKNKFDECRKQV
jgi:hypothetical protein